MFELIDMLGRKIAEALIEMTHSSALSCEAGWIPADILVNFAPRETNSLAAYQKVTKNVPKPI